MTSSLRWLSCLVIVSIPAAVLGDEVDPLTGKWFCSSLLGYERFVLFDGEVLGVRKLNSLSNDFSLTYAGRRDTLYLYKGYHQRSELRLELLLQDERRAIGWLSSDHQLLQLRRVVGVPEQILGEWVIAETSRQELLGDYSVLIETDRVTIRGLGVDAMLFTLSPTGSTIDLLVVDKSRALLFFLQKISDDLYAAWFDDYPDVVLIRRHVPSP